MNKIYKYQIRHEKYSEVTRSGIYIPRNGLILKVAIQGESICIWVSISADSHEEEFRRFCVVYTGVLIPTGLHYLDTVFDGDFVLHVFEEK